jgi:hypothetical protein
MKFSAGTDLNAPPFKVLYSMTISPLEPPSRDSGLAFQRYHLIHTSIVAYEPRRIVRVRCFEHES